MCVSSPRTECHPRSFLCAGQDLQRQRMGRQRAVRPGRVRNLDMSFGLPPPTTVRTCPRCAASRSLPALVQELQLQLTFERPAPCALHRRFVKVVDKMLLRIKNRYADSRLLCRGPVIDGPVQLDHVYRYRLDDRAATDDMSSR